MPAMSRYLEAKLIDHIFRATTYDMPSTLYIALLTTAAAATDTGTTISNGSGTGVEVPTSGTGYARKSHNPSTSNWLPAAAGVTNNLIAIVFGQATADWGTIRGVAICDAATNGNMLFYGTLATPQVVQAGDTFQFKATKLQAQLK